MNAPRLAWAALILASLAAPARADILISNGGFEAGFTNWTRVNQLGSEGNFFLQSGTLSPLNGDPVPSPPGGVTAAMTDAFGPGSHVMYQDFVVPAGPLQSATLKFDLFVGNRHSAFFTPNTLDFATPALNQQARVDILRGGTDAFSLNLADLLLNAFRTQVGDPTVSGYTTFTVDLTALLSANRGNTLRLRFAEVDNVSPFQLGVDNVSLDTTVPEPATAAVFGLVALLGLARFRRRGVTAGS